MTRFDFMGRRRLWFWINGVLLAVALASLLVRGLNLGIDFTGGMELDARFHHPVTTAQVRRTVEAAGVRDASVQLVGRSGDEVLIKMPALSESGRRAVEARLAEALGPFRTISLDKVTGVVSGELVRSGILEVLIASALIILYMTIRFDFRFALSGIFAVFYDAILTIGFIALWHLQVTEAFIPAVLTIVGYSINDRIIIFDRIRENLHLLKKADIAEITNVSLNQTLGRSINTAVIVILAMLAILLFGGASTRDFAATTVIGVLFGAYSSIFFASPIWVTWMERVERRQPGAAQAAVAGKGRPAGTASAQLAAMGREEDTALAEPAVAPAVARPPRPRRRSTANRRRRGHGR